MQQYVIVVLSILSIATTAACQQLFFYKNPGQVQLQMSGLKMDSVEYYSTVKKDLSGKYPVRSLTYSDSLYGQKGSLKIFFDRKSKWKSSQFLFDRTASSKAVFASIRDSIQHRFGTSFIPYANIDFFYYHFVRSDGITSVAYKTGIVYDLELELTFDAGTDLRLTYGPSKKLRCRVDATSIN